MSEQDDIIQRAATGEGLATRDLFRQVYDELKQVAFRNIGQENSGHTLTATALVHEAFVALDGKTNWQDATHLYRTAAKVMRQILIDHARRKKAQKRASSHARSELDPHDIPAAKPRIDPVEFHEVLTQLHAAEPLAATVFEMRYYAGLTFGKIAEELSVSVEKVEALWKLARTTIARGLSRPD